MTQAYVFNFCPYNDLQYALCYVNIKRRDARTTNGYAAGPGSFEIIGPLAKTLILGAT